jgi:hypothetical protein
MNIFRDMKIRLLGLVLLLMTFSSCREVQVEFFSLIEEDCDIISTKWSSKSKLPKGVYYVAVDTANCLLEVKYDESETSVASIHVFFESKKLHFLAKEVLKDSAIVMDTIIEVLVVEPVSEKMEQNLNEEEVEVVIEDTLIN